MTLTQSTEKSAKPAYINSTITTNANPIGRGYTHGVISTSPEYCCSQG